MLPLLLALTIAAAEPPAPGAKPTPRLKLLVLDVKAANADDIDAGQVETLTSVITVRAARFPFEVVSSGDIRQMLELEEKKQAAGCDTTSASCLAEIAGALGADLVLSTRAGKLDAVFVITLQLYDARASKSEGRGSVEAWSLQEASAKIGPAVDELLTKATGASPTEPTVTVARALDPALAVDDDLRVGLKIGGGVGAGVGIVTAFLGALPAMLYSKNKDELVVRTDRFDDSDQALADAALVHEDAVAMKALYNDIGRWGLLSGALLTIGGVGALAAGFLLPAPIEAGGP
jgi:hypothetical protein